MRIEASITGKRQVTVPKELYIEMGLKNTDKLIFYKNDKGEIVVVKKEVNNFDICPACEREVFKDAMVVKDSQKYHIECWMANNKNELQLSNNYVANKVTQAQLDTINRVTEVKESSRLDMVKNLGDNEVIIDVPVKLTFMENKPGVIGMISEYDSRDIMACNNVSTGIKNLLGLVKNEYIDLENLGLPDKKLELVILDMGVNPTLYDIVETLYKHGIYSGLDYLYENYNDNLYQDFFMERLFLELAKMGEEEKIEYFYKKSKDAIKDRVSFDRFLQYKESKSLEGCEYGDRDFTPLFDEGLKALCTKKKYPILKKLYSYGFKASLAQLKVATRTLNEDVFYTVFEELNNKLVDDYVPKLIEELCYYSKIEPIKFLFERIGANYISQDSINKALLNIVNGTAKGCKLEMFKYILEFGADVRVNNNKIFEKVFGYGHVEILEYLYEVYPEIDEEVNYDLEKYINEAMKYNKVEIIKYLVESGRYKNSKYNLKEDKELLDKYCSQFNKNKDVVEYLIKEVYIDDKSYIEELKFRYPKQRKFQDFMRGVN